MYIGKHKSEILDESYLGSSPLLKKAIKKYGKENFTIEILEWCESDKDLNEREVYWINYYNAIEDDMYYNLNSGGYGGFDYINKNNLSPSRNHDTHPMLGKTGKECPNFGKKHTQQTKDRLSEFRTGKISINNGIESRIIDSNDVIPDGWSRGLIKKTSWNKEKREQQSQTITGRKFVHNEFETKLVKPDEVDYYLSIGYKFGKSRKDTYDVKKTPMYNKKHSELSKKKMSENRKGNYLWITNGEKCLRVKPTELEQYLSNGWVRGRK